MTDEEMAEEQKKQFELFYDKRSAFNSRHFHLAENIEREKWLKNELFRYYEKGINERAF